MWEMAAEAREWHINRKRAETILWLAIKPGAQPLPLEVAAPHRLPARLTAVSLPHRPPRIGGGSKEPVVAAQIRSCSACTG